MHDSGGGIEGQAGLRGKLQIELYLDHDAHDLPGSALITREDMMDRVASAAEFESAQGQVDNHSGQHLALRHTHCTRDLGVQPEVLSFFPVHVSQVCMPLLGMISFRIHFFILPYRKLGC
jgi:hypothetical protein